MLEVYLLRHGQTAWNAAGNKYCGRTDVPLTGTGLEQARKAAKALESRQLDAVYSSPLERARHTAEIAGGGRPVQTDQRLIEVDFGNWEGKTREEFIHENPALWEDWRRDPGAARAGGTGETALEVVRRVDDFFNWALARHDGQTIMVAGHNGINRLYLAWKLGMPLSEYRRLVQENSTLTRFTLDAHEGLTLWSLNCNS